MLTRTYAKTCSLGYYTLYTFNRLQYIKIVEMRKNGKGKQTKPKSTKQQSHLILQLTGTKPAKEETKQEEEVIECKYGIYCAHLRAAGACSMPHRRHNYLILNLVPPAYYLEDLEEAEEEIKLSKRERKEKKIIQKTISQHIDVEALTKQELVNKKNAQAQIKQQFLQNMNEVERQVADIVTAETAEQYFQKLNEAKAELNVFELKKRSMIQLKKKSQKVYADIIDKEYRIAHRLIKESAKNTKKSLLQIYQDINHNTIPSVRQYFEGYLQPAHGIPQQDQHQKCHLASILHLIFFRQIAQIKYQYYVICHKSSMASIVSNIEFFNMVVPYLHSQAQPFNKYLLINCEEELSLTTASQLLARDYSLTFHIKCKPAPEYPFGQLSSNLEKFAHWAAKIANKYKQTNKQANIILVLQNFQHLFTNLKAQEFEQEKLKQRRQTFRKLLAIFQPVIYFLSKTSTPEDKQSLQALLGMDEQSATRYQRKLHDLEEK